MHGHNITVTQSSLELLIFAGRIVIKSHKSQKRHSFDVNMSATI